MMKSLALITLNINGFDERWMVPQGPLNDRVVRQPFCVTLQNYESQPDYQLVISSSRNKRPRVFDAEKGIQVPAKPVDLGSSVTH